MRVGASPLQRETYLAENVRAASLHPCRDRNRATDELRRGGSGVSTSFPARRAGHGYTHRLHSLPRKGDRLLRISRNPGLTKHHDLGCMGTRRGQTVFSRAQNARCSLLGYACWRNSVMLGLWAPPPHLRGSHQSRSAQPDPQDDGANGREPRT